MSEIFCPGATYFNYLLSPEEYVRVHHAQGFYQGQPLLARITFVVLNMVTGSLKPLLLPVLALIGMIVFPLFTIYHYWKGNMEEANKHFQASGLALAVLAASALFLITAVSFFSVATASFFFVGMMTLSVTFHVYRAVS